MGIVLISGAVVLSRSAGVGNEGPHALTPAVGSMPPCPPLPPQKALPTDGRSALDLDL